MYWWKMFLSIFLIVGLAIAIYSVYKASVAGTMDKLGLVGADFASSVNREQLADQYVVAKSGIKCGLLNRLSGTIQLLVSADDRQGELSFRLGKNRILCGAEMLSGGIVENGTHEVLKGMGYLQDGYRFVQERAEVDYRVCRFLPEADLEMTVNQILLATEGRVHDLLFDEWAEVRYLREQVDPVCLEERQSVR